MQKPISKSEMPFILSLFALLGFFVVSNPVAQASDAFQEVNGLVVIEAENYHSKANTSVKDWYIFPTSSSTPQPDPDPPHATGTGNGKYVEILPDTRVTDADVLEPGVNFFQTGLNAPRMNYQVLISSPGRYYVRGRAFRTGGEDNSVHFGFNNNWPTSGAALQWCDGINKWTWSGARRTPEEHCGILNELYLDLPSGEITLMVGMREDGFELDRFVLTKDPAYFPTSIGPAESPRVATNPESINSGFDANSEGFAYRDDAFRGTIRPAYASGAYAGTGGYTGGGLQVTLGGVDTKLITDGMSGGWARSFTLSQAGTVAISLRYRLTIAGEYESDEYSQVLLSVDGNLIGLSGRDYLYELRGADEITAVQDSGWRTATLQVTLSQGTHTLAVGAWNNKKTELLEVTQAYFDDIVVSQSAPTADADGDGYTVSGGDCNDANTSVNPGAAEICDDGIDNDCDGLADCLDGGCAGFCGSGTTSQAFGFDANSDGFAYRDDTFRGTIRPAYASGVYTGTGGYTGGGLQVTLGGVDTKWVTDGMSGGWAKSFTVNQTGTVAISLRYRLTIAGEYESDEYSQVLVSVDGNLLGASGSDYVYELRGTDEITAVQDTGWRTATLQLNLTQGTHTLAVGAWNNKKTELLEVTRAYFDDIVISQSAATADGDGDGYTVSEGDCNDANVSVNPGAAEICDDGIDNDCDGLADCLDGGCAAFCGGGTTSQAFGFDANSEGFAYRDDAFRGTIRPAYASGAYTGTGGYTGGGLQVTLGGVDTKWVTDGMSGGWAKSFTVIQAGAVAISLRYRLTIAGEYESDEYSQVLVSVDGNLLAASGSDYVYELRGTDEITTVQDSGWRTATLQLNLPQGTHTLAVGAWNNKKTELLEVTRAYFDDIVISQSASTTDADGDGYTVSAGDCNDADMWVNPGMAEICDDGIDNDCDGLADCLDGGCDGFCGGGTTSQAFGFDTNSEGFAYQDNAFRGTNRGAYASGAYTGSGGYTGGGLQVTLGGVDAKWITDGMSGGWSKSFTVDQTGAVAISLRYRLTIAGEYESDEYSQVLVSLDGNLLGASGSDYVYELRGTDETTAVQDSGWRTATLQLSLSQGTHTLAVGAWNNKKTELLEVTRAYFDDIVISQGGSANLLVFEDFTSGDTSKWTVVDESAFWPSDWRIINGRYTQLAERVDEWQNNYHLGSFSYYNQGGGLTDYDIRMKITSLSTSAGLRDSMGIMFRYKDKNNYYRFLMSRMQGIRRLEKKTNGQFTTLAFDGRGFNLGQEMVVDVIVEGSAIIVSVNNEVLFSAIDSDHAFGSIALFTQGPTAFDDISVTLPLASPRLALSYPGAFTVASTDSISPPYTLEGAAVSMNLSSGNGVKFIRDGGTSSEETCLDFSFPFTTDACSFNSISPGEHTLEAIIVNSSGQAISDPAGLDFDKNAMIGFGGKYAVAFGDSISNGVGDNDTADDNATNGKNLSRGLTPPLNNRLASTFGLPVVVYNEGLGGTTSTQGLSRISQTMTVHPQAQLWLVLFGTNDSSGSLPLDKATYKLNLSRIIDAVLAAGRVPALAKVPFVKNAPQWRDDLIKEYNAAVDELVQERALPVAPPDFYTFFKANPSLYYDDIHPNGSGYREMAIMWQDAIINSGVFN